MRILGVLLDDHVEVDDSLTVLLDHLVGLCALMDVSQVARDLLDALRVGEDRLFDLLEAAVGQAQMVVDVCFVGHERLGFQGKLHCLDTLLVLFEGKVGDSLLVEDLRIVTVVLESFI